MHIIVIVIVIILVQARMKPRKSGRVEEGLNIIIIIIGQSNFLSGNKQGVSNA